MLERTAGCLESGSLRRLLPASRKSIKSCRTLHSGFWVHGGGDIELSPFWAALVRATAPMEQQDDPPAAKSVSGQPGLFLDFLYPAGTLNFLRQYSIWGTDRQDSRWTRQGMTRIGQRQYTSSAKDNSSATDDSQTPQLDTNTSRTVADANNVETLLRAMGLTHDIDFEEAWRQYELLPMQDRDKIRPQMMSYLSTSDRPLDNERVMSLFQTLDREQRTMEIYHAAIRSCLKHLDLKEATRLQDMALNTLQVPIGADQIFAYHLEKGLWVEAMSYWEKIMKNDLSAEGTLRSRPAYEIFQILKEHPRFIIYAFELTKEIRFKIATESNGPEIESKLLNFGTEVVQRAMLSTTSFYPSIYRSLLEVLESWERSTPSFYKKAMHMLLGLRKNKLALQCYRGARVGDYTFSVEELETILKVCCQDHDVSGMKQVLDDFFKDHGRPSGLAYRLCMQSFAAKGDSSTVHALWEQFVSRFADRPGLILYSRDFAPLLHVHAIRGELEEVREWFIKMRNLYHLHPATLCWNILINAHGKVHDYEGAYDTFQDLLNDSYCIPNGYTIGTLMGICTQQGDIDRVVELYMLAQNMGIETTPAMLDNLVLAHIQDDDIEEAEKICEQGITMELKGSLTRMWNYLLVAHVGRRDLNKVNGVLRRMSELGINNDAYTYSALMSALCMVDQPDRAYKILKQVMPDAGIQATSFHYAVVMGGFIGNGEPHKSFQVQNEMLQQGISSSGSSKLLALKSRYEDDKKRLLDGTTEDVFKGALQLFREAMQNMDIREVIATPKKGAARHPIDLLYPTMFYSYVMHILASVSDTASVDKLYADYMRIVPDSRQAHTPLQIMSALMLAKYRAGDHDSVEECWRLVFEKAKERGRPLKPFRTGQVNEYELPPLSPNKIVPYHQLDLSKHLYIYLQSLSAQDKGATMVDTVDRLLSDGFQIDNRTWNLYIQLLTQKYRYRLAFKHCEDRLMKNWTGWQMKRWEAPVRNRLAFDLRQTRKQHNHLRPLHVTLLHLARSLLDISAMAAESKASEELIEVIRDTCPRVIQAIETMPRTDSNLERQILRNT